MNRIPKFTQLSKKLLIFKIVGLFTSDYSKSLHGRFIAKQLKTNQKTISNALKELYNQNVLTIIKKGNIKEYSLKITNPLVIYYLEMAEAHKALLFLSQNFQIMDFLDNIGKYVQGGIIVFGSYAKGTATEKSDLDLLLLGKINKNEIERIQSHYTIKAHITNLPEIIFKKGILKKETFMEEVAKSHILIKCQSDFIDVLWRRKHG